MYPRRVGKSRGKRSFNVAGIWTKSGRTTKFKGSEKMMKNWVRSIRKLSS